ncbi:MAG: hypothetical protein ACFE7E_00210 [Candidatus Hodarchaeota archaeon]
MAAPTGRFSPTKISMRFQEIEDLTKCNLKIEFYPPVNIWEFIEMEDAKNVFKKQGFKNVDISSSGSKTERGIFTVLSLSSDIPVSLAKYDSIISRLLSAVKSLFKKLPLKVKKQ